MIGHLIYIGYFMIRKFGGPPEKVGKIAAILGIVAFADVPIIYFSVFDEQHVWDWLAQFELNNNPDYINVNLDESSRAYWLEVNNDEQIENEFMKIIASREVYEDSLIINIEETSHMLYKNFFPNFRTKKRYFLSCLRVNKEKNVLKIHPIR